jgi:hypothetical protein
MDLISFEDLVVQPYNSYFSLEKELHEVKSQLSLMEKRLKYLEDKKPKKKRHVKQEDTDVKQEIEKKIQNDSDRNQRLINRNELRKKNEELQLKRKEEWEKWDKEREYENKLRKKIHEDEESDEDSDEEIEPECKNVESPSLPSITIQSSRLIIGDKNYYEPFENNIHIIQQYKTIDRLTIHLHNDMKCYDLLRIITETKILRLIIYSYPKLESLITLLMIRNIKVSFLQIENNINKFTIGKLRWYCYKNNIQLKVIVSTPQTRIPVLSLYKIV